MERADSLVVSLKEAIHGAFWDGLTGAYVVGSVSRSGARCRASEQRHPSHQEIAPNALCLSGGGKVVVVEEKEKKEREPFCLVEVVRK